MPRIVALSDTHGGHRRLEVPEGDILIHAGDMTRGGSLESLRDVDEWLGQFPHPHKLVVAGNCDYCFERDQERARQVLSNARYLQDESVEIDGLRIWGSPWQPIFLNMAFNVERGEALARKWEAMPDELDVLITHGPPRGILDRTSRGEEVGDRALRTRIEQVQPKLHIFGHVHESSGETAVDGVHYVNAACDAPGKEPVVIDVGV